MKLTLSIVASLLALPAFAGQMKVECSARSEFAKLGELHYLVRGEQAETEGKQMLGREGMEVFVMRKEVGAEEFSPTLEHGTLALIPSESADENIVMYNVPESSSSLVIEFHREDSRFIVRHSLTAKKEILAEGLCSFERIAEEEKAPEVIPEEKQDEEQQQQAPKVEEEKHEDEQQQQQPEVKPEEKEEEQQQQAPVVQPEEK